MVTSHRPAGRLGMMMRDPDRMEQQREQMNVQLQQPLREKTERLRIEAPARRA